MGWATARPQRSLLFFLVFSSFTCSSAGCQQCILLRSYRRCAADDKKNGNILGKLLQNPIKICSCAKSNGPLKSDPGGLEEEKGIRMNLEN